MRRKIKIEVFPIQPSLVFGSVLSGPSKAACLKISFYFDKVNLERLPKLSGGIRFKGAQARN